MEESSPPSDATQTQHLDTTERGYTLSLSLSLSLYLTEKLLSILLLLLAWFLFYAFISTRGASTATLHDP